MGFLLLTAGVVYLLKSIILTKAFLIFFIIQSGVFLYYGNKYWNVLIHIKNSQKGLKGYEEFSRTDTNLWSYPKLMIGCVFLAPFRIYLVIAGVTISAISMIIVAIGHKEDQPITGLRRVIVRVYSKLMCKIVLFATGYVNIKRTKLDCSYEQYLGEDYKKQEPTHGVSSISNHYSWVDVFIFMGENGGCSFVSKKVTKNIPGIGTIARLLGTVFVDRGSTRDEKDQGLKAISEHQHRIDKLKGETVSMHVFAEGATTNGQQIIPFKRGVFDSLLPLKPFGIRHSSNNFNPAHDAMPLLTHMLALFSQFTNQLEIIELPTYFPTEYLYKNYSHLGKEKWEIYSESLRRIMANVLNVPGSQSSIKKKHELIDIMFPPKQKKD